MFPSFFFTTMDYIKIIIQRNAQYESGKEISIPHLIARSFNFLQLFFYDIFFCNAYFTSYWSSKYTTESTVNRFFTDFLT